MSTLTSAIKSHATSAAGEASKSLGDAGICRAMRRCVRPPSIAAEAGSLRCLGDVRRSRSSTVRNRSVRGEAQGRDRYSRQRHPAASARGLAGFVAAGPRHDNPEYWRDEDAPRAGIRCCRRRYDAYAHGHAFRRHSRAARWCLRSKRSGLSITAVVGFDVRPSAQRARSTSAVAIFCQRPLSRQP